MKEWGACPSLSWPTQAKTGLEWGTHVLYLTFHVEYTVE
jgi:hypothetical protein